MTIVEEAVRYAVEAHAGATRKGKGKPYILHPLEALVIVSRLTDDRDVLAAAVLHDTVEDTDRTLDDIRQEFGPRVAALVAEESEDKRPERPACDTWKLRKQETIDHLRHAPREALLVCLGDKLSNLRELSEDHAKVGEELWQRFNQKEPREHAWYYRSILAILCERLGDCAPLREYRALADALFGEEE